VDRADCDRGQCGAGGAAGADHTPLRSRCRPGFPAWRRQSRAAGIGAGAVSVARRSPAARDAAEGAAVLRAWVLAAAMGGAALAGEALRPQARSEEHTSELQS